jgi:hypothetical protein
MFPLRVAWQTILQAAKFATRDLVIKHFFLNVSDTMIFTMIQDTYNDYIKCPSGPESGKKGPFFLLNENTHISIIGYSIDDNMLTIVKTYIQQSHSNDMATHLKIIKGGLPSCRQQPTPSYNIDPDCYNPRNPRDVARDVGHLLGPLYPFINAIAVSV